MPSPVSESVAAEHAELINRIRANGAVPRHIAIIMDGNGRWAREQGMPRTFGHRNGMKSVRAVVEGCLESGVEWLSLFAFSQENWQRPDLEVKALMALLEEFIAREIDELRQQGVRVRMLGDLDRLSPSAMKAVNRIMSETSGGTKLGLNIFISYGGRAELVRAARSLAQDVKDGRMTVAEIDEDTFGTRLFTSMCPDPDLLIRTSGEKRLSNFLLWQIAYAELYISNVLWPDFKQVALFEAIVDFQKRDRRYGRVTP